MNLNQPIYLDYHATTPIDPRVLEVMLPYFNERFGNAASKHAFGSEALAAVKLAQKQIGALLNCKASEIIFTSGATESINLAHFGVAEALLKKGRHLITSSIEHSAMLESLKVLEKKGFEITYLSVDKHGLIYPEQVEKAINQSTILVSLSAANNEIGTIYDLKTIGKICKERNILFHIDAAQAVGKFRVDTNELNADLLSISAHKFYGPKGIGALFIKGGSDAEKIIPQIYGGGHEKGLRAGTLNVPAIVGFGKAAEISASELNSESIRLKALRDKLLSGLQSNIDDLIINGDMEHRLVNNLNVAFPYVSADLLLGDVKEIAFSTGSACSSASSKPSHVLAALEVNKELLNSSVRFGLGRFTTEEEIDYTINRISEAVKKLRAQSPAYSLTH